MKSKLKTIAVVATAHLLLFWISIGILKASGFTLFSLFGPPPPPTVMQQVLWGFVGISGYPTGWICDALSLPDNWFTIICGLVLNSAIWGTCIGLVIYGFRHRHHRRPA